MNQTPNGPAAPTGGACKVCGLELERRAFLRTLVLIAGGALAALGATPSEAAAVSLGRIRGRDDGGGPLVYRLPGTEGVEVDRENEVIIARHRSTVSAFALSCPHQRSMLKWLAADGRFQCTKHKSKYGPDGAYQSGRATRNMDRHPVTLREGALLVDRNVLLQSDEDPAAWAAAIVRL
jgi:nitrite reductase/ring-hydroxylating ferredoxin subunit